MKRANMGVIRIPAAIWDEARAHMFSGPGEHFGFFFAKWSSSQSAPIFLVKHFLAIEDSLVTASWDGYELTTEGLLRAINYAVKNDYALIEMHNHGGIAPTFSQTDKIGLAQIQDYIHSSLPNRPYGALVWGDDIVAGQYSLSDGKRGRIRSVTVFGGRLYQAAFYEGLEETRPSIYTRQEDWFGPAIQDQFSELRIAIVGCGGTGSHMIQQLAYLGCGELVLVDNDLLEASNLNRVITGTYADLGVPKVALGAQLARRINPRARVEPINKELRQSLDVLKGVDILIGCVDNDGARLVLNELSKAFCIPMIDIATGISVEEHEFAGGRVVFVLPDGPCMLCAEEIDPSEASYFLASEDERRQQVEHGYVQGMEVANPSVVSLNATVCSVAVNELIMYVSGKRSVNSFSDLDIYGVARGNKAQWLTPCKLDRGEGCLHCALEGLGDESAVDRYKI